MAEARETRRREREGFARALWEQADMLHAHFGLPMKMRIETRLEMHELLHLHDSKTCVLTMRKHISV